MFLPKTYLQTFELFLQSFNLPAQKGTVSDIWQKVFLPISSILCLSPVAIY